jgi:hypothetical protein
MGDTKKKAAGKERGQKRRGSQNQKQMGVEADLSRQKLMQKAKAQKDKTKRHEERQFSRSAAGMKINFGGSLRQRRFRLN